jgi:hypothetical protein
MSLPYRTSPRFAAAIATACAGLALASAAEAIDLRDWGRKIPMSERFVVLAQFGNQAALDKESQLVWEKIPEASAMSWYQADYNRCAITPIGGRYGWRLPSRFELMSLLDPSVSTGPKLPLGHPFMGIVNGSKFWTSSTVPNPNVDYVMHVTVGPTISQGGNLRESANIARAWCVRGQGSPTSY